MSAVGTAWPAASATMALAARIVAAMSPTSWPPHGAARLRPYEPTDETAARQ